MKDNPGKPRFQFSLRVIFLLTTLVALIVAFIVGVALPVSKYMRRELELRQRYRSP